MFILYDRLFEFSLLYCEMYLANTDLLGNGFFWPDGDCSTYLGLSVEETFILKVITRFDDHPENHPSWKSTFISAIAGLGLTENEDLKI